MFYFKYAVKSDFSHLVTRKLHKSHVLENYLITKNELIVDHNDCLAQHT